MNTEDFLNIPEKDNEFVRVMISIYKEQSGIFCIEDLRKRLNQPRKQTARIVNDLKKFGILKDIDNKEARKILQKWKGKRIGKLGRKHYYRVNLKSPFAKWMRDTYRWITIDVLQKEFNEEAYDLVKDLVRELKKRMES